VLSFCFQHLEAFTFYQNMEKHLPKAYDMLKSNPTCGPMGTALESFKSRARVQVKLGNKDGEIVDGEIVIA